MTKAEQVRLTAWRLRLLQQASDAGTTTCTPVSRLGFQLSACLVATVDAPMLRRAERYDWLRRRL
jgi:hypothetical protein